MHGDTGRKGLQRRARNGSPRDLHAGGRFDEATGEPESWQTPLTDLRVQEWARRWVRRAVAGAATADSGVGDRGTRPVHS